MQNLYPTEIFSILFEFPPTTTPDREGSTARRSHPGEHRRQSEGAIVPSPNGPTARPGTAQRDQRRTQQRPPDVRSGYGVVVTGRLDNRDSGHVRSGYGVVVTGRDNPGFTPRAPVNAGPGPYLRLLTQGTPPSPARPGPALPPPI